MQDEALTIEIPLALRWEALPETAPVPSCYQHNLLVFSLLDVFAEPSSPAHEPHSSPELQRIENKLNLLIEMVKQLSGQSHPRLAPVPVKISCKGLAWRADSAPAENASLLLELYLDGESQHAVKIVARVLSVSERDGGYYVHARFSALNEIEENHLEKWIFAQHRRMVAQRRSRHSPA